MSFIPLFYVRAGEDSARELVKLLIELGSFFAARPSDPDIRHVGILGGYIRDFNIYKKALILNIKGREKSDWGISRIIRTFKYLSEINPLSPLSARIYFTVERPIREAWSPSYIKLIHENLKKSMFSCDIDLFNYYVEKLKKLGLCVENPDSYISALSIVAWSAGAHRHSMALKQIAAQELIERLILHREESYSVLVFLTALIVDTYAWLPYIVGRREIALTTELQYAIAATPLRELESVVRCLDLSQVIPGLRDRVYSKLKKELECVQSPQSIAEFNRYIDQIVQIILKSVGEHYNNSVRMEVLLGRLNILLGEIVKRIEKEKPRRILVTLTEQTAPALIEVLQIEATNVEEVTVIYTPQTLYNRLLFAKRLSGIKRTHYIPVTSTEPTIAMIILKERVKNHYDLAIVQGSLIVSLSVLSNLYGCIDSSKIVFI